MADRGVSHGDGRRKAPLVKGFVGALVTAVAVLVAVIGITGAYSRDEAPVDVHKVDKSPQDIRKVWTPERLEEAKKGDPMPGKTQD